MKTILAIGNSFSMNTTQYFNEISNLLKTPAFVTNLYIPGCSLEMHSKNLTSKTRYTLQVDALSCGEITLYDALDECKYDIITIQQASDFSGVIESLEPHLTHIKNEIAIKQSDAQIFYHQTWSYDSDASHPAFETYDLDSKIMYDKICNVSHFIRAKHKLPIIYTGSVLEEFRSLSKTSSITKDGYHLKNGPIRIIASLVWFDTLIRNITYDDVETVLNHFNIDIELAGAIYKSIHTFKSFDRQQSQNQL